MSERYPLGTHVLHEQLGIGKVVYADASIMHVYFRDKDLALPERRVSLFKPAVWHLLKSTPALPDLVLDHLPPWTGTEFARFKTTLTIDDAKKAFLHRFPDGMDDPGFVENEIDYKRAATVRFNEEFLPQAPHWIEDGDADALARGIEQVYGRHLPKPLRLNLLFHGSEEPAYVEAIRGGGAATVEYVRALLSYLASNERGDLERYIKSLSDIPHRSGGISPCTWPTLTWLPFIASPHRYMLVKPTIIQAFASARATEIGYRPTPNAQSYTSVLRFAEDLRRTLQQSEVNLARRELDMIDTQSFMWVVERYTMADAAQATATAAQSTRERQPT